MLPPAPSPCLRGLKPWWWLRCFLQVRNIMPSMFAEITWLVQAGALISLFSCVLGLPIGTVAATRNNLVLIASCCSTVTWAVPFGSALSQHQHLMMLRYGRLSYPMVRKHMILC